MTSDSFSVASHRRLLLVEVERTIKEDAFNRLPTPTRMRNLSPVAQLCKAGSEMSTLLLAALEFECRQAEWRGEQIDDWANWEKN